MRLGSNWLTILTLLILLAACGKQSESDLSEEAVTPLLSAATLGEQQVLSVDDYLAAEPFASAAEKNGKQQAQICRACHSFDRDGANMIGPALHGVFGRQAGAGKGFKYSQALQDADFIWTPRALDAWLSQPGTFLPGNTMTFAGIFKEKDRNDLIAFLLLETSDRN